MKRKKRSLTLLLIGLFSLLLLGIFTHSYPPSAAFSLTRVSLPSIIPFFILFFLTLYGIAGFALKSHMQGFLAGVFSIMFLILRMFGFTHWFFSTLLVALFIALEFVLLNAS